MAKRGESNPIYQVVPLATVGGGWIRDGLEVRWGQVRKLRQNPGLIVEIRRMLKNEGGLIEDRPRSYFIKNGQTTANNQATADGCTADMVYEALRSHPELGRKFKLLEYTKTQEDIDKDILRHQSIVSIKDQQTLLNGTQELADGKAASLMQTPESSMRNASAAALQNAGVNQTTVAGISSVPKVTDSGMIVSEIRHFAE